MILYYAIFPYMWFSCFFHVFSYSRLFIWCYTNFLFLFKISITISQCIFLLINWSIYYHFSVLFSAQRSTFGISLLVLPYLFHLFDCIFLLFIFLLSRSAGWVYLFHFFYSFLVLFFSPTHSAFLSDLAFLYIFLLLLLLLPYSSIRIYGSITSPPLSCIYLHFFLLFIFLSILICPYLWIYSLIVYRFVNLFICFNLCSFV